TGATAHPVGAEEGTWHGGQHGPRPPPRHGVPPDRAGAPPSGRGSAAQRRRARAYRRRMSTYPLPPPPVPLVARTASYAANPHPRPVPSSGARELTPLEAANVIGTIDAVCDGAPASDLPFEVYAALDELGASLTDWLAFVSPDRVPQMLRAA